MAVTGMKNDVKDWLPSDFPETKVLDWYRQHFYDSNFVAVSWDGCNADDPRFQNMVKMLQEESIEKKAISDEDETAHQFGDELGLHTVGGENGYFIDWGEEREKWLLGHDQQWYYIKRDGKLYKWDGDKDVISGLYFMSQKSFNGSNKATGTFVRQFGTEEDNEYYEDPSRLYARFFRAILTGPMALEQLAGDNGTLVQSGMEKPEAFVRANQILTGSLFGPTPRIGFSWKKEDFRNELTREQLKSLDEQFPDGIENKFEKYVQETLLPKYEAKEEKEGSENLQMPGSPMDRLLADTNDEHLKHWLNFFFALGVEPPARPTCILVTLNSPAGKDLARVVGRPVLGKPKGRILELASHPSVGIAEKDLHVGGPPSDNVAIDEEGTITLLRLVGFSTLVGWTLAFVSFRSFKVTFMVFFVGAVSAIASLGMVWYANSSLDAILMSMPSLVYVLGLSGAVHIVNYYREACYEDGPEGAAETAVRYGWFPCTLAAFTTSLGLISLYVSSIIPIKKFGLFAAIGTMLTVILLFTYLPSSLHLWPPGYKKRKESEKDKGFSLHDVLTNFWIGVGHFVTKYNVSVTVCSILVLIIFGIGLTKIQTSVQLIKLFDDKAKVLNDYRWLEANLGQLVPMEITLRVRKDSIQPETKVLQEQKEKGELKPVFAEKSLSLLERVELVSRVRREVELWFGERGKNIVGHGASADQFLGKFDKNQFGSIHRSARYRQSLP